MAEQNRSDHATNVTAADGNVTAVSDILERLHDILDGPVPMYVSRQDIRDVINEIERLHQKEQDILAGIQLVVKGSNAGRDKEIERLRATIAGWSQDISNLEDENERLNTELDAISLALDEAKQDTIYSVASKMAALILRLPCECEEYDDGTIVKYCDVCSAYMDWEKVMSHVK